MTLDALSDARAQFMAFPAPLQAAMKAAAKVERWSPDLWRQETILAAELIAQNHYAQPFIDALVVVYQDAATPTLAQRKAA